MTENSKHDAAAGEDFCTKASLSCKLSTPGLRERKATVIAGLKKQLTGKEELPDGYVYAFKGDDATIDELISFIKTERLCCDFFSFNLKIAGDAAHAWLSVTGPEGAKTFIDKELEF